MVYHETQQPSKLAGAQQGMSWNEPGDGGVIGGERVRMNLIPEKMETRGAGLNRGHSISLFRLTSKENPPTGGFL